MKLCQCIIQLVVSVYFVRCLIAVDMLLTRRIVSDCSRFVRQFYMVNSLAQQSSSVVVPSSECMIGCLNMTSRQHGTESDATEQKQKDNVQQSPEDEDCQTSAKRLKASDSSLENAVGVTSHKFYNNTVTHTHPLNSFFPGLPG